MSSVGHIAAGLAAARIQEGEPPRLRSAVVLAALATFPDLDLFLVAFGARPDSPWAHRGASHSLLVALVAAALAFRLLDLRSGRTRAFVIAFVASASHGLFDTLTPGGAGVMLLWPFREARYLAPFPVLPATPFGHEPLLSVHTVALLIGESLFFAPLVVFAFWRGRGPRVRAAERGEGRRWTPGRPASESRGSG